MSCNNISFTMTKMGNSHELVQKVRQRFQSQFRRVFPKVQKTLKKLAPSSEPPRPRIPGFPVVPVSQEGLSITTTIRFEAPFQEVMARAYQATDQLEITQELVDTLTRRIDHCTNEMITRSDANADRCLRHTEPRVKPARFHIMDEVHRDGKPIWDRYFTSYQHTALTRGGANDIVLEIDRLVGMFLETHDPGFEWRQPELECEQPLVHKTVAPEPNEPQSTHCVPLFQEPGYSIQIVFRTRTGGHNVLHTFKVDSHQCTPLTLDRGENLFSQLTAEVGSLVEEREDRFWTAHYTCDGFEGLRLQGCRHFEDNAFELILKVANNFGPEFGHLAKRHNRHSRLVVPDDVDEFLHDVQRRAEFLRRRFDQVTDDTQDLVISVHELRSYDWKVKSPMAVVIDSSSCRDRITTEKILQRIQTGMYQVLKGHGTTASITAHKRGHLVLDATICHGENFPY